MPVVRFSVRSHAAAALALVLLVGSCSGGGSSSRPPGLIRGPYLQLGTSTSVVVRWRTGRQSESCVRYGTAPGVLDFEVLDPAPKRDHEVALTGLDPETTYYYSVGTRNETLAGGDGFLFTTAPIPGTSRPVLVWVLGDSGTANARAEAVRDAYSTFTGAARPDVWLMLGDNAYDSGTDSEYQDVVFEMYPEFLRTTVLWPALGNHDGITADSSSGTGPYYDIFTLPENGEVGGLPSGTEAYYSFDFANVHFVCLDSHETDRSPGGAMLTWLENDLAATTREWIIAYWHHPPYSKGSHDSDVEFSLVEMRTNVVPVLEDAGVDLVLAGHSHSYERTFLIHGHHGPSTTLTADMVIDGGDGRPDGDGAYLRPSAGMPPRDGTVYCVAGSSGRTSGGSFDHPAVFVAFDMLGSLVIRVDGPRLDVEWIDTHADVRDHFSLIKNTGP